METLFSGRCVETVGILHWAFFGAGEACIDLSARSLLIAVGALLIGLLVLQFVARRLWRNRRFIVQLLVALPLIALELIRRKPADTRGEENEGPVKDSRF